MSDVNVTIEEDAVSIAVPDSIAGHATAAGAAAHAGLAIVSASAPADPADDQLWYDKSAELMKRWDDAAGEWVAEGRDTYGTPPGHIHPPVSQWGTTGGAAWPAAERVVAHYFNVRVPTTLRYVNLYIAASAGNIQVGTVKLSGANLLTFDRVMDSGVIASPGTGVKRIDCGATVHEPGDYAAFLYADSTSFQTLLGASSAIQAARLAAFISTSAGGVGASGTFGAWSTNYIAGLSLEGDV